MSSKRPYQIAVLGSDEGICTDEQYDTAFKVGELIAEKGHITLTGGGAGVMEAALKGAHENEGITVGIIPEKKMDKANHFCDVIIASGIGLARDEINIASSDGVILVGGGAGTMNEATFAYMFERPIVAVENSGGTAEKVAGEYLDERETEKILSASSAEEAVDILLEEIEKEE